MGFCVGSVEYTIVDGKLLMKNINPSVPSGTEFITLTHPLNDENLREYFTEWTYNWGMWGGYSYFDPNKQLNGLTIDGVRTTLSCAIREIEMNEETTDTKLRDFRFIEDTPTENIHNYKMFLMDYLKYISFIDKKNVIFFKNFYPEAPKTVFVEGAEYPVE